MSLKEEEDGLDASHHGGHFNTGDVDIEMVAKVAANDPDAAETGTTYNVASNLIGLHIFCHSPKYTSQLHDFDNPFLQIPHVRRVE